MKNENILAVNVPNGISILIMGGVLALLLAWGRHAANKKGSPFAQAPQASFVS